jgi:glycosyltransferase involved in cell wall biosynthesis
MNSDFFRNGRLHIVHVVGALPIGGVELNLLRLLTRMSRYDHLALTVVSLTDLGPIGQRLKEQGITVLTLNNSFHIYDFRNLLALTRLYREIKPDVIHTHLPAANLQGRLAALLLRTPVVIAHEHSRTDWKNKVHWLWDRFLGRYSTIILTPSEYLRRYVAAQAHLDLQQIVVFPNCVDFEEFRRRRSSREAKQALDIAPESPVLGSVARLDERKGLGYLLEAMQQVNASFPTAVLLIAGSGPLHETLELQARQLAVYQHVRFLGEISCVRDILEALDLFVLPSVDEGFGLAVVEAMALAIPVIVTDQGGLTEIVQHQKNGILTPTRDHASLSAAIISLLKRTNDAAQLGEQGYVTARQHYSVDDLAKRLESLYRLYGKIN